MHYTLEYPPPDRPAGVRVPPELGRRRSADEIAPARTFGFVKEIETLEQMGLANGGRLNNFILVGDEGVVNAPLRFPDEFVRHKILDIMGDFYLLGRPIRGRIVARQDGTLGQRGAAPRAARALRPAGAARRLAARLTARAAASR